jgi:hypothetical protein
VKLQIADCRLQIYCRLAALLAIVGGVAVAGAEEIIDRVVAVVAGDVIMLSDVRAARDFGLIDAEAGDSERAILSRLIERSLILDEVDRYTPAEPAAAAVDEQLRAVRARFAAAGAFESALERSGIDEAHLRAILRDDLRARTYLAERFPEPDAERRRVLIAEWVAGLRRRAVVVDLYDSLSSQHHELRQLHQIEP